MLSARILSLSLSLLAGACPAAWAQSDPNSPIGEKFALVVGISKFKNPQINLQFAEKDAQDFSDFLIKKAGFPPNNVKMLTNESATQKAVLTYLGSQGLPKLAGPNDLVVIFISTHGSPAEMDEANFNYVLAYDSEVDNLYATAIDMQDLVDIISRRIGSKRIMLVLDACHAGAFNTVADEKLKGSKGLTRPNLDISNVQLGEGKVIFLSSSPNEKSWELKEVSNSIFTRCLIDTLSDLKQQTTLADVYKKLKTSVLQTALRERGVAQTPVMKSTWVGKEPILALAPNLATAGVSTISDANPALQVPSQPTTPLVTRPPTIVPGATPTVAVLPPNSPPQLMPAVSQPPTAGDTIKAPNPMVPPVTNTSGSSPLASESLPPNIAVIPFMGPLRAYVAPSQNVLWGKVSSVKELVNLGPKLTAKMFHELRSEYKDRTVGPRMVSMALGQSTGDASFNPLSKIDTSKWTAEDWKRVGRETQARYLITGSVDEATWGTSFTSNKYHVKVSAKLISGDTGQVLAAIKEKKVNKAPWQGDVGGGQKYFENEVMEEASEELVKEFKSVLKEAKQRERRAND